VIITWSVRNGAVDWFHCHRRVSMMSTCAFFLVLRGVSHVRLGANVQCVLTARATAATVTTASATDCACEALHVRAAHRRRIRHTAHGKTPTPHLPPPPPLNQHLRPRCNGILMEIRVPPPPDHNTAPAQVWTTNRKKKFIKILFASRAPTVIHNYTHIILLYRPENGICANSTPFSRGRGCLRGGSLDEVIVLI